MHPFAGPCRDNGAERAIGLIVQGPQQSITSTGIVVTCPNEKSQLQNKGFAMRLLQAKLLERKRLEERAELDALKGDGGSSGATRCSYVLHPYQMIMDLRTHYQVGNPAAVLDGDIDGFLEAGIRWPDRRDDE